VCHARVENKIKLVGETQGLMKEENRSLGGGNRECGGRACVGYEVVNEGVVGVRDGHVEKEQDQQGTGLGRRVIGGRSVLTWDTFRNDINFSWFSE
jgi:hypothetical protein